MLSPTDLHCWKSRIAVSFIGRGLTSQSLTSRVSTYRDLGKLPSAPTIFMIPAYLFRCEFPSFDLNDSEHLETGLDIDCYERFNTNALCLALQ